MAGAVARMEELSSAFKMLVSKPQRKRPLARPRSRWWGIEMNLNEIKCEVNWIQLAQYRDQWYTFVNNVTKPNKRVHFLTS
jgi:hypothetical protein